MVMGLALRGIGGRHLCHVFLGIIHAQYFCHDSQLRLAPGLAAVAPPMPVDVHGSGANASSERPALLNEPLVHVRYGLAKKKKASRLETVNRGWRFLSSASPSSPRSRCIPVTCSSHRFRR